MEFRRIVWPGRFSITIPAHWQCAEEGAVVSCCDPANGVGAFQVSLSTRTPSGEVTKSLAQDVTLRFASSRHWKLPVSAISVREKPGTVITEFEYQEDGKRRNYWRVAHILASTRLALLTYTCEQDEAGVEDEIVRRIFDKFELELLP